MVIAHNQPFYSFDAEPEPDLYEFEDEVEINPALDLSLDKELIALAQLDSSVFIKILFGWPLQRCHIEWQELFDREDRFILWAPIEHGKTSQLTGRILWDLGKNPNARIALISNTGGLAMKILGTIKQHILLNPKLPQIFPHLRPEMRAKHFSAWHTDKIVVERDDLDNKDYSVQAIGIMGGLIGSRIDRAYLDDVLDFKNTLHATARKQTLDWYDSTVESRISADGKVGIIGTAWNREDLMHMLAARPGWVSKRYDANDMLWPDAVRVGGKLCGWPRWRLEKKRETIPALEFNRQFRNLPLSQDSEIFNLQMIQQCIFREQPWDPEPEPDWQIYVGVDLNVKKGEAHDKTSFFIGRTDGQTKIVLNIIARNMNLAEILETFHYVQNRYEPVLFLVENNAAQDYIVQLLKLGQSNGNQIPRSLFPGRVQGFTTGSNKIDPILGIRGMTLEFEQHRWRIPDHPLTKAWTEEMLSFDPYSHTGDILMSAWLFHSACLKYRPRRARAFSVSARD